MPSTVRRRSQRIQQQVSELGWAVPQVVNQRVTRMMMAGTRLSARDAQEFQMMGAEKVCAFYESWAAFGEQMWTAQHEITSAWLGTVFKPGGDPWPAARLAQVTQSAALGLLGAGLAPIHRRAVGNARRLKQTV